MSKHNTGKFKIKCIVCGKTRKIDKYLLPTAKFCSRKCRGKNQSKISRGSSNPNWKGGQVKRKDGRIYIYAPNHPKAIKYSGKGLYVLEYRLIAEKKIGRYLKDDEVIHHIDGNTNNNNFDNLMITTQVKHAFLHFTKIDKDKTTGRFLNKEA